jgi:proteic killer suppression protein
VIRSFKTEDTERLFNDERVRQWQAIENVARRKLNMVHAAARLEDLRVPPGNRLEKLEGNRKHQHSIRINDQYRVCFEWREGDAYVVEIVDYH